ncbi:FecR family protein [Catenovulum agarivorans]|uniref:FecR family protein n=1 Tax=Catenovulum agarivorans TaxID=1172192 RepID=UPI0003124868|nr:FecR family protein [Catenovulum agarivorans]
MKINFGLRIVFLPLAFMPQLGTAADIAGRTLVALGDVAAVGEETRPLKRRSAVYDVDTVTTGPKSKAQFKMMDGGLLAVKENTQLIISTYEYDPETDTGSAVMNLLSGGIRTISGKIKNDNGEYQLKTPVGSIGIRGTHFEIELVDGEMFIAVWDGAIDVNVEVGGGVDLVSFGANENFSFGKIQANGQVTGLLTAPEVFDSGHSVDPTQDSEQQESTESEQDENDGEQSNNSGSNESSTLASNEGNADSLNVGMTESEQSASPTAQDDSPTEIVFEPTQDETPEVPLPEEFDKEPDFDDPTFDPIADRVGIANFSLDEHQIVSSLGAVSDVTVSMQINFDQQSVERGFLSFSDEGGEWLARFNGAIRGAELDVGVNYASHGDNLAEGEIDAIFTTSETINGNVALNEVDNPEVNASGTFELTETNESVASDDIATDL